MSALEKLGFETTFILLKLKGTTQNYLLKHINQSSQELKYIKKALNTGDLEILHLFLNYINSLKELKFCNNNFGGEKAKCLAKVLENSTSLQKLYLTHNNIGASELQTLEKALISMPSLTTFSFSDEKALERPVFSFILSAKKFYTALFAKNIKLKTGLPRAYIDCGGASTLGRFLQASTCNLTELILKCNNLNDEQIKHLATALESNATLKILKLNRNSIGNAGAQYLIHSLFRNNCLEVLHLNWNEITNKGAVAFALFLRTNLALKDLNLNANNIRDKGTKALLVLKR